jgi:hypothetical protein
MIEQILIAIFGVGAVWLSQDPRASHRRWASVLGLLGQPAWFVATIKAEQWGIVALCAVYAASWGRGFWHYWIVPRMKCS